jgi:hypothetical protein
MLPNEDRIQNIFKDFVSPPEGAAPYRPISRTLKRICWISAFSRRKRTQKKIAGHIESFFLKQQSKAA